VAGSESPAESSADELFELVREIRERVRSGRPRNTDGSLILPDLSPILRARDMAEAKVAAIGAVNPRPPGALNSLVQSVKRTVARLLDWHIREQVEFNRATVEAIGALLEALNESNRALRKIAETESSPIRLLRTVADLHADFKHRAERMEEQFRELTTKQHGDFTAALDRTTIEIQKRLWSDMEKMRLEFERLIYAELRLVRQRAAFEPQKAVLQADSVSPPVLAGDYLWFAERFRGSREYVREKQRFYVPFFQGCGKVLDIGCGRGEFLELMRDSAGGARGIDVSADCVALCKANGLEAEQADAFDFLARTPESSLDGIFCAQVVEHLAPGRIPELVRLSSASLRTGGLLVIETPNPECLAALSKYFYLDPSHERPIPSALLRFYMEEYGLGGIEVHSLSPAEAKMPSLASVPAAFRSEFFGGLDYAILGRKL
jgi:O-antigen chain-terminating methyltransferase